MTELLNSLQLIDTRTLLGFASRLFMVYILYRFVAPPNTWRWEKTRNTTSAMNKPFTMNKKDQQQDYNAIISNIDKVNVTVKRSLRGVNVYGPYKKSTMTTTIGTNTKDDYDDECRNKGTQRRDYDSSSKNHPADKSENRAEPWLDVPCDPRDIGTPDEWIPRDRRMIRLTGRHPLNCETPVKDLHQEGFLTPQNLHVIRNHGSVPELKWESHVLMVHIGRGQSAQSLELSMEVLDKEFPHTEFPVTISCCGNRRKEINMIQQTIGFHWGIGGIGTCLYKGVLVRDILVRAGIDISQDLSGKHVEFIGAEDLPNKAGNEGPFKEEPWGDKVKYATSIPLSKAMSMEDEVMVALECNGERLHPDRGYPCRLVIPGYIGGRMIKWLSQIKVLDHESYNCYHYWDNKYLPPQITADRAVREGWWYKQEYIINELSLNSVITYPNHNDTLSVIEYVDKTIQIQGYAHAGGGRPITRVEISTTHGEVWDLAEIHRSEMPNPFGKFWCWIWWTFEVDTAQLQDEIWVRAWDSSHSPQPERPVWTLMGQSSNHIFRVKVHVDTINETLVYRFEHPTQPGQQTGGWATRVGDKVKSAGYGKIEYNID